MLTSIAAWLAKRWLGRRVLELWSFGAANPWRALAIVALLWGAWEHHRDRSCQADRRQIHAAQAGATKAQVAVNHEPARKSGEIARKSDAEAPAYYRGIAAAADAHAIRLRQPAGGAIGPAHLPGADPAEQGIHGPAIDPGQPGPDLVCRPAPEDRWLVSAAARAAEMHQEALDLIAAGVAIPEPDAPKSEPAR